MKEKVYYIKVAENELDNIEQHVRKKIIEMMTKEIADHSKDLAKQVLQNKPLTKKKWYQL